jgi:hypothetical protein
LLSEDLHHQSASFFHGTAQRRKEEMQREKEDKKNKEKHNH